MRIWVLCTGEPVPFLPTEAGDRFLRAGKLSEYLAEQGHDVVWWTARFDHYRKTHREIVPNELIDFGLHAPEMVFLDSCGYQNHMGPRRFLDHWQVGRAFRELAPQMVKPDVIVASFPLVELCDEVVAYGKRYDVPVILDIRDLWPDVIYDRLADRTGISGKGLFFPYERKCKRAFRQADRVIGITKGMQGWCYDRWGRDTSKQASDGVFRQFKPRPKNEEQDTSALDAFWLQKGVDLAADVTRCVWTGSIIPDSDGPTLINALAKLPVGIEERLQIIVAGRGSLVAQIEVAAAQHPCLKYVGWIGDAEMNHLLERSHIGLLCYLDRFDFQVATPNKVIDYCAASMRILTNLTGEVKSLAPETDLVVNYPTGDAMALARLLQRVAEEADFRTPCLAAKEVFDAEFDAARVLPDIEAYLADTISVGPLR